VGVTMQKEMILEKQKQAADILKEKNIDLWLTFVRETGNIKDPMLEMIVGTNATWHSAFMITSKGERIAIVGSLEVANMESVATFPEIIGYLKSVKEDLVNTLKRLDPKTIAVNFSRNQPLADGLTHGMYLELKEILKDTPYGERLLSSEEIVAALRGRKSETELELVKESIKLCLKYFDEVTKMLTPGVSEKEVAEFVQKRVKEDGLELSWEAEYCPSVFTGPDTAGAHSGPTDRKIQRGHVINLDFGVKYKGYCSDLQRTWYVLKDGETEAPPEVMRGFNVIKESISLSAAQLRPGKMGWEIDEIARGYVVANGYEEYPHGTGHQVGKHTHDGGGMLGPRWDRYGNVPYLPIEEGQIYTIEPRLTIPGFGIATIEEEVVITEDGCKFLSPRQTELYLIK